MRGEGEGRRDKKRKMKRKQGGEAGEQERGGTLTGHGPMPVARRWKLLGNSTGSGWSPDEPADLFSRDLRAFSLSTTDNG